MVFFFFTSELENKLQSQKERERIIGVWVMIKSEKDGKPRFDESIGEKYTYAYKKNGDFILDFRIVRNQVEDADMSIMDYPKIKWSIVNKNIEYKAFDSNGRFLGVTSDFFYFSGDTLVTGNAVLTSYYLKISEK
ncbi:hypothetical protein Aoki45_13820 [Algoriphagus sp. oki45]|nr:hypothetical protein Aoki45_13820 [Algoriphagus sp. oki45]